MNGRDGTRALASAALSRTFPLYHQAWAQAGDKSHTSSFLFPSLLTPPLQPPPSLGQDRPQPATPPPHRGLVSATLPLATLSLGSGWPARYRQPDLCPPCPEHGFPGGPKKGGAPRLPPPVLSLWPPPPSSCPATCWEDTHLGSCWCGCPGQGQLARAAPRLRHCPASQVGGLLWCGMRD